MSYKSIALGINIDHVATLRQARRGRYPDPVHAALAAEMAGADSITLHLREDRRHIQVQDVRSVRDLIKTHMNLPLVRARGRSNPWRHRRLRHPSATGGSVRRSPGWGSFSTVASAALIGLSASEWKPALLGERGEALLGGWRRRTAPGRLLGCLGVFTVIFLLRDALEVHVARHRRLVREDRGACPSYAATRRARPCRSPTRPVLPLRLHAILQLQHYGAALVGRLLSITPTGEAYNVSFCLLIALGGAAFSGTVVLASRKLWVRALVISGFVVGGMGTTLLVHLTDSNGTHGQACASSAARPWTRNRWERG